MATVLSLFDGIACGMVALKRAGIKVDSYYASEIEPNAIKVAQRNYPQIIQVGDVTKLTEEFINSLGRIDILIGGSPCQDLGVYKYGTTGVDGLQGEKSKLFYHYYRIFKIAKPEYFLLENVPMRQCDMDIISELLGVKPMVINSELVSASSRKRLYWTNIPNIMMPSDKGLVLRDIVLDAAQVPAKYWYTNRPYQYNGDDEKVQCTMLGSGFMRNNREVYNLSAKSNTLMADGQGGNRQKKVYQDGRCRKLMPIEYERLQTLPDNYTDCVADCHRYTSIGNGWTVDVISHIFSFLPKKFQ